MVENEQQNKTPSKPQARLVIYAIMCGVLVWGAFHAVGAYLFNYNPWRAVVVLTSTFAFLGFWGWLLHRFPPRREG